MLIKLLKDKSDYLLFNGININAVKIYKVKCNSLQFPQNPP